MQTAAFLKAYIARKADAFIATISSSRFAAAQRRRALAGLDTRQLADIGLIYVDGDYRPHPDALSSVVPDEPLARSHAFSTRYGETRNPHSPSYREGTTYGSPPEPVLGRREAPARVRGRQLITP